MAIEITADEMQYGSGHVFLVDGEQVPANVFLSVELSHIEEECRRTDGVVPLRLSWLEDGNRKYLYPWMEDGQGRVAGMVLSKNWSLVRDKMQAAGINSRITQSRKVGNRNAETTYEFSCGEIPAVVIPDGHVSGRGRPKASRKKELRKIVERAFGATQDEDKEMVDHPAHYQGRFEAIDVIEDSTKHLSGPLGFNVGNDIKYSLRLGKKHPTREGVIEELEKKIWYIRRSIDYIKAGGRIFAAGYGDI